MFHVWKKHQVYRISMRNLPFVCVCDLVSITVTEKKSISKTQSYILCSNNKSPTIRL